MNEKDKKIFNTATREDIKHIDVLTIFKDDHLYCIKIELFGAVAEWWWCGDVAEALFYVSESVKAADKVWAAWIAFLEQLNDD